ncbi:bile acid:sodium symporter family protein [Maricurvus nonylphenolicus]|uniref:bile acid:sodium symporter family protein n=1 Tax=Maricurvus nonylphenolicus TaxID=1008307 RepID=UPI0036F37606
MGTFYIEYEYWLAAFQLVMAMLGMGAALTPKDFREVLIEPKAVSTGSLIQVLLVPVIGLLFIQVFGLAGGVAVGVAIIVSIPGGSSSNIFTHFARGNIALSITITALTTLACLITVPLILDALISGYMRDGFAVPRIAIMKEIALTLLLPLTLGMAFLRYFPDWAETFSTWCVRASLFGLLVIVVGSSMSGRLDAEVFGQGNMLMLSLLLVTLVFLSWLVCRLMGLSTYDAAAIEMEVTVRNINLGIMLKASLFPAVAGVADPVGDMALFSLLFYGAVQMLISGGMIAWSRLLRGTTAAAT